MGSNMHCQLPPSSKTMLVSLEVACGGVLSDTCHVLLTNEKELASEINSLRLAGSTENWLLDIACVLQYVEGHESGIGNDQGVDAISCAAQRVLAMACDNGCPHLAEKMLAGCRVQIGDKTGLQVAEEASKASGSGLGLLHRAVRSGNIKMVECLLAWSRQERYRNLL